MTTTPSPEALAELANELERLSAKATPGKWELADWTQDDGPDQWTIEASEPELLRPGQSSIWPDGIRKIQVADVIDGNNRDHDGALIVALRNNLPAILAALRRPAPSPATAEVEKLREALRPFAACVRAVKKAFPNDPFTAGTVCRDCLSFGDFERAYVALGGHND
jgi:hypothetical protein